VFKGGGLGVLVKQPSLGLSTIFSVILAATSFKP
jgi:hypothetical protein